MKIGGYVLSLLVVASIISCGTSEQACVENCAMAFSKSIALCNAQHGRSSSASTDCSDLVIADNDQCTARCYGK